METPVIEVVRSVRPEVTTEGLRGQDLDKLEGLPLHPSSADCPIVREAPAWLACRVEATVKASIEAGG